MGESDAPRVAVNRMPDPVPAEFLRGRTIDMDLCVKQNYCTKIITIFELDPFPFLGGCFHWSAGITVPQRTAQRDWDESALNR